MSDISERGYAHPDVLVSTDWVAEHLNDPKVRIIESDEDPLLYTSGHVPGAVEVDWTADLNDPLRRDYLNKSGFEALMSRIGVTPDTLLVFYGDKNNWWATYAYWVFQLFGHHNARIMDGGRLKWEKEGRPMTREKPSYPPTRYICARTRRPADPGLPRTSASARPGGAAPDRRAQPAGIHRGATAHAGLPK